MKKNILKATLVAAFGLIAGFNVYNSQKSDVMSDLALANVEALASGEIDVNTSYGYGLHIPEHTRSHSGGVFTSNKGLKQPRFYPFHPQKRSKNGLYDRF